jgi:ABC-type uncharacterized transport system permease subunit
MIVALLAAAIRLWMPLAFTAMGGVLSERVGVINIGLEGMMLSGAYAAVAVASKTGNAYAGLVAGMVVGGLVGLLHAIFTLALRVPHILSGVGINLGALGLTTFLLNVAGGDLKTDAQLPPMAPLAVVVVLAVWFKLYFTPRGLRLRACGENPMAARSAGVPVAKLRYGAVMMSGALAGLGGVALTLTGLGTFTQNMTAGRGYIALAAVIFGRWHPLGAAAAALFFGLGDALQLYLQTQGSSIPPDFLTLLPYVLTLAALAGFSGRSAVPAALGDTE